MIYKRSLFVSIKSVNFVKMYYYYNNLLTSDIDMKFKIDWLIYSAIVVAGIHMPCSCNLQKNIIFGISGDLHIVRAGCMSVNIPSGGCHPFSSS